MGRPKKYGSTAERVKAWRARKAEAGLVEFSVFIPADILASLNTYVARTGKDRDSVIANVIKTQVLRKR